MNVLSLPHNLSPITLCPQIEHNRYHARGTGPARSQSHETECLGQEPHTSLPQMSSNPCRLPWSAEISILAIPYPYRRSPRLPHHWEVLYAREDNAAVLLAACHPIQPLSFGPPACATCRPLHATRDSRRSTRVCPYQCPTSVPKTAPILPGSPVFPQRVPASSYLKARTTHRCTPTSQDISHRLC